MQPSVALCMIVRDEQAVLARCLHSAAEAVDAIYVTDTGSTDDTPGIARQFDAHVRRYTWCDDFSAARNESIRDVPEDWILILDADDELPPGEARRLRAKLAEETSALALTLQYEVMQGYTPAPTRRVLRNHRGLRFEGIIHESVRASLPVSPSGHTVFTDLQLRHLGYSPTALPDKLRRNLPLLEKEWERCRHGGDACQRLHIGKELAQTWMELGQPGRGEDLLGGLLQEWPAREEEDRFAAEAVATLLWRFHHSGRDQDAWNLCRSLEARLQAEPSFALYHGLGAFRVQRFDEALRDLRSFEEHWLAHRVKTPVPVAYTGLALWDLQGQCLLQTGRADEAAGLFTRCLEAGGDAHEYKAKLHLARQLSTS